MPDLTHDLSEWLALGLTEIGQIHIAHLEGGWALSHRDDAGRTDLEKFTGPEAARALAHYDDAGNFRPLKTAPNLRHGWRLLLESAPKLHRALDYFYPAMLGVFRSHERRALPVVPLRETLARQTGMYRVTQKITAAQAEAMIADFCSGCLKRRLWTLTGTAAPDWPPAIPCLPLLCHEACNLLVAKAREVVKRADLPS